MSERPRDSAETRRRKSLAMKGAWANPELRQRMHEGIKRASVDPKVRQHRREAQAKPEVRQRKSEASKRSWADAEVHQRRSAAIKRALAKPEVHQRRIEANERALAKPVVRQHRREATQRLWADPHMRERWSEASKRAWADPKVRQRRIEGQKASWTAERRIAQSRRSIRLWEERNAAIKAANRHPRDWREKPFSKWRFIATFVANVLLSRDGPVSNRELGEILDKAKVLTCPGGGTWSAALSSDVKIKSNRATRLVAWVRRRVNKPGRSSKGKLLGTVTAARLTSEERSASARRAAQARWANQQGRSHE